MHGAHVLAFMLAHMYPAHVLASKRSHVHRANVRVSIRSHARLNNGTRMQAMFACHRQEPTGHLQRQSSWKRGAVHVLIVSGLRGMEAGSWWQFQV